MMLLDGYTPHGLHLQVSCTRQSNSQVSHSHRRDWIASSLVSLVCRLLPFATNFMVWLAYMYCSILVSSQWMGWSSVQKECTWMRLTYVGQSYITNKPYPKITITIVSLCIKFTFFLWKPQKEGTYMYPQEWWDWLRSELCHKQTINLHSWILLSPKITCVMIELSHTPVQ